MNTRIFRLDKENREEALEAASDAVKRGGTVVFPTETVYGLGANALDGRAVRKIFEAKNRPQDNPLIVHVSDVAQVEKLAVDISGDARKLMDRFFPGPLTLIMKKSELVPDEVSHGLDTVGIRMPSNKDANEFIRRCGVPIAAPSANLSKKPSITSEEYLERELSGRVDVILLAGDSEIGVESTVIDVSGEDIKLLRPGRISASQIEKTVGRKVSGYSSSDALKPKSPGMKYAHYRPDTKVVVITGSRDKTAEYLNERKNENIGFMGLDEYCEALDGEITSMKMGRTIEDAGRKLYLYLRKMDEKNLSVIYAQGFGMEGLEMAYMNRLLKSAGGDEIKI